MRGTKGGIKRTERDHFGMDGGSGGFVVSTSSTITTGHDEMSNGVFERVAHVNENNFRLVRRVVVVVAVVAAGTGLLQTLVKLLWRQVLATERLYILDGYGTTGADDFLDNAHFEIRKGFQDVFG